MATDCKRACTPVCPCVQVLYPLMQCTDVFFLKADVCQLGVDQRKVTYTPTPPLY